MLTKRAQVLAREPNSRFGQMPADIVKYCLAPYLHWTIGTFLVGGQRTIQVLKKGTLRRSYWWTCLIPCLPMAVGMFLTSQPQYQPHRLFIKQVTTALSLVGLVGYYRLKTWLNRLRAEKYIKNQQHYLQMDEEDQIQIGHRKKDRRKIYSPEGRFLGRETNPDKLFTDPVLVVRNSPLYLVVRTIENEVLGEVDDSSMLGVRGAWYDSLQEAVYILAATQLMVRIYFMRNNEFLDVPLQGVGHLMTGWYSSILVDGAGYMFILYHPPRSRWHPHWTATWVLVFDGEGQWQETIILPCHCRDIRLNSEGHLLAFGYSTNEILCIT